MSLEEALVAVEQALDRGCLSKTEEMVFRQCWDGRSYMKIAQTSGYDSGYIKDTGYRLWQRLSEACGEKVTKQNFKGVLRRVMASDRPALTVTQPQASLPLRQDWGEAIDVSRFYGRSAELDTLSQWIVTDRCRVITLLGMGGMGKTALSVKLAEQVQGEFEYVIWRSLRHAPAFKDKLTDWIKFLSHQQLTNLPASAHEQITCLIDYLRKSRCLLVLDNFDTLLQSGKRSGNYREGYEAYGELLWRLGETQHQSCVVLTSREKPAEVAALAGKDLPVRTLVLPGLELTAGQTLLTLKGLSGTDVQLCRLVEHYRGNPLALRIAATSIQDMYGSDITDFFAGGTAGFTGISNLLAQHFGRLSASEQQVMFWLAIHREAISIALLQITLVPALSNQKLIEILESLSARSLIERGSGGFTQQPVVMEYVTDDLIGQVCQEIVTESPSYLLTHALMQAQAKDYIRESQTHLLVQPLIEQLRSRLGSDHQVEHKLNRLITKLRDAEIDGSYGGGNLLNLLAHLDVDLTGYDFSHLKIRQADLRSLHLHRVNFSHTHFRECALAATFGGITCAVFSPDGQQLATSDTNGEIYLWNANEGQQQIACTGHNSWVWSVAFHPLQPILASCGQDQTVKLWHTLTGRCLHTLQGHTGIVTAIAFSPNGERLASVGYDRSINLWDVATGVCIQTLAGSNACIWSVAFHPAGHLLAIAGEDNTIRLLDLATGEVQTLEGHQHWVKAIAFSPDGRRLVSGSFDQRLRVWDLATGVCVLTLPGHSSVVTSVAFSPAGDRIASGSYDQTVKLWDAETGQGLDTLRNHTNRVWSVAFHPQENRLVSGGDDHAARIWQLQTGQCIKTLQGHSNAIYAIAHSASHQLLISAHEDQTVKLWDLNINAPSQLAADLQPFRVLRGHGDRVLSIALSQDGQQLASGSADRTIKLWNPHTGKCVHTLHGHESWVWAVAFSPNSKMVASASYDHTIRLWDAESSECIQILQGHPSSVLAIAFNADSTQLVSGGYDQMIKRWDINTGKCIQTWQAHTDRVWAVAFSPNNQCLATGGDDQTVKLWDLSTGACLHTLQGHTSQVLCLRFTPEGSRLISSSADRTIKIWDILMGQCLTTLQGHQHWVSSLSLSPDAQTLLTSSWDETIKCWKIATGDCWHLRVSRPCENMIISGAIGLTEAEMTTLKALGAIESVDYARK